MSQITEGTHGGGKNKLEEDSHMRVEGDLTESSEPVHPVPVKHHPHGPTCVGVDAVWSHRGAVQKQKRRTNWPQPLSL